MMRTMPHRNWRRKSATTPETTKITASIHSKNSMDLSYPARLFRNPIRPARWSSRTEVAVAGRASPAR